MTCQERTRPRTPSSCSPKSRRRCKCTCCTRQRAVFTLFELEGMTGDDVAEVLGIPLGTAYSRLRLARESFRKAVRLLSVQAAAGRAP